MVKQLCTMLLDSKMAENENFIRFTFYELRVKHNLSEDDTDEFLRLAMTYLENKSYEYEKFKSEFRKYLRSKYPKSANINYDEIIKWLNNYL